VVLPAGLPYYLGWHSNVSTRVCLVYYILLFLFYRVVAKWRIERPIKEVIHVHRADKLYKTYIKIGIIRHTHSSKYLTSLELSWSDGYLHYGE
jgi:hypothetical protein